MNKDVLTEWSEDTGRPQERRTVEDAAMEWLSQERPRGFHVETYAHSLCRDGRKRPFSTSTCKYPGSRQTPKPGLNIMSLINIDVDV